MMQSTARAEQFYERTGSESTKGSRKGYSLLGGGECAASVLDQQQRDEAERRALHGLVAQLASQISNVRATLNNMRMQQGPGFVDLIRRRDQLIAERAQAMRQIEEINARIRLTKPKPAPEAVPAAFLEVAREVLTKAQFEMILKKAFDRARKETA